MVEESLLHAASGIDNNDASRHLSNPRNGLLNLIFVVSVYFCGIYNHPYDYVG